jgi:DNA-binding beta-propeller fold protein YncE
MTSSSKASDPRPTDRERRAAFAGLALSIVLAAVACSPAGRGEPAAPLRVIGSLGSSPGKFRQPRAVAVDRRTGDLYVVDRTGRIQRFAAGGDFLGEWRLPAWESGFPVGLTVEADGSVLVNDSHQSRILRYRPDGTLVARWGSPGLGPGEFTTGRGVAVDSDGHVYAGDYGGMNDRVQKFTAQGAYVLEWGGRGEAPGLFRRPQGMAVEVCGADEHILVADSCNHRVQRFRRDGSFVSAFGTLGRGPGELRFPYSVAVGEDGTLFVAEWGNNRVQGFDEEGRSLGCWGSAGRAPGELSTPWSIAVGTEGRLYVADYGNHRVQVFRWPVPSGGPGPRVGRAGRLPR